MEKGWTKIYSTEELFKAELIKNLLINNSIEAILINKKDSSYVMIGDVEIYVKQEEAMKAANIIEKDE